MEFNLTEDQLRWRAVARDFSDHVTEKFLRDAASFLHSDGTNQVCLLRAAQALAASDSASEFGF